MRCLTILLIGLAALAHAQELFPLVGCWRQVPGRSDICEQWWGYQLASNASLSIPIGINNRMLYNDRPSNGARPPIEFSPSESSRSVFATRTPCAGMIVWTLNNNSAHARIGHATHHCDAKQEAFATQSLESFFPPVNTAHCDQYSFDLAANGNCLRLDTMIHRSMIHTQVLDVSMQTLPRKCTPGSLISITLSWSLRRACDAVDSISEPFATIDVECSASTLHFGIDGRVQTRWAVGLTASTRGVATRSEDHSGRALVRALDRLKDSDHVYFSVTAHADKLETRMLGALVRLCYDSEQQHAEKRATYPAIASSAITPIIECSSRLDEPHGDMCRSWFGYMLNGSASIYRPVGIANAFVTEPFDRGQPIYFRPGTYHYVFAVVWNCSDYGQPMGPMLTWAADATATANRRSGLCHVGCDGIEGSTLQYDRCGVCGGNGQTCNHAVRADGQYCDGDHEKDIHMEFTHGHSLPPGISVHADHATRIYDPLNPPTSSMGMPNTAFGGPGIGPGGSRLAFGANSEHGTGILGFDPHASAGCMRVSFDRPVHMHRVTVININAYCDAETAQTHQVSTVACVLSSDCVIGLEACVENKCVPLNMLLDASEFDDDAMGAQSHAILTSYERRGYTRNEHDMRCKSNDDCEQDGCTIDVCVCERCMHRQDPWCCMHDSECETPDDACEEATCDFSIHRCVAAYVGEGCCSREYECTASSNPCMGVYCVENECLEVPINNCCRSDNDCVAGGPCTTGECIHDQCTYIVQPGCCGNDTECPSLTPSPTDPPFPSSTPSRTKQPVASPTPSRTKHPVASPTPSRTKHPLASPTPSQTKHPLASPPPSPNDPPIVGDGSGGLPTPSPTDRPLAPSTPSPTDLPLPSSTPSPSDPPSMSSSSSPTDPPSMSSSITITGSSAPSRQPTSSASAPLTQTITTSSAPSITPTATSTRSGSLSAAPSASASSAPSGSITSAPTSTVSVTPSRQPTVSPSRACQRIGDHTDDSWSNQDDACASEASPTPTRAPHSRTPSPSQIDPCANHCTLWEGYWHTHTDKWDQTKSLCGITYGHLWNTSPTSQTEVWLNLNVQTMAAILNSESAGSPDCVPEAVTQDITSALTLLEAHCNMKLTSPSDASLANSLRTSLEHYNRGVTGPGECFNGPNSGCIDKKQKRKLAASDAQHKTVRRDAPPVSITAEWSKQSRSWVSVYSHESSTVPVRREQIPLAAANNGVAHVDVTALSIKTLEVCSCSPNAAIVAIDYVYTGSMSMHDVCGVCGGDGSSCTYAPIDTVQMQTRIGTSPLDVQVFIDGDGNDVYEICYFHARQPSESRYFSHQALRIAFEPHAPCSLHAAGTCDSITGRPVDEIQWCTNFADGPEETTTNGWRFDLLGNESLPNLDCTGDLLFTCPVGDGTAGYRVCRNLTLFDMLTCTLRDGRTNAVATEFMPDHSVQYSGTIYATELTPVQCTDPRLCERVEHQASRRFVARTHPATGRLAVDFDSANVVLTAAVISVTCDAENDGVRVHFSTQIRAAWANAVHLMTPVIDGHPDIVITALGIEDPVQDARQINACVQSGMQSNTCTQLWTVRLPSPQHAVRFIAVVNIDGDAAMQTPAVFTMDANVPCDSAETVMTGVRRNDKQLADGGLVMFHDRERRHAHINDLVHTTHNSFTDGGRVYGRVHVAKPDPSVFSGTYLITLDEFHLCYSFPPAATYIPYDPHNARATGCMSPGTWLVSTLYRRGGITSDGDQMQAKFTVVSDAVEFEYAAWAATTSAAIYIDARWHVSWTSDAETWEFARNRLSQHRADAIAAKRGANDWLEPSSILHAMLTPHEMQVTRDLPSGKRAEVRTRMMMHAVERTGLTLAGLVQLMNGSVQVQSVDMSRRYGAYDDDVWYGGGYGYYQVECPEGFRADNNRALPPTESACAPCRGAACTSPLREDYNYPCVWPCWNWCWECDDKDNDHSSLWWLLLVPIGMWIFGALAWSMTTPRQAPVYRSPNRRAPVSPEASSAVSGR